MSKLAGVFFGWNGILKWVYIASYVLAIYTSYV